MVYDLGRCFYLAVSVWPVTRSGSEFMPIYEGNAVLHADDAARRSVTKSAELLQRRIGCINRSSKVASLRQSGPR